MGRDYLLLAKKVFDQGKRAPAGTGR